MDIQLPEVSGLEVTRWLKEDPELKAIPVVAVTAFAMKSDEERIRQGGCEAYLSKPISVAKFIETIRRFIGIGGSTPPFTAANNWTRPPAVDRKKRREKQASSGIPRTKVARHAVSLGPF